jgi:tetratricopeptide (TPR) repeat protein
MRYVILLLLGLTVGTLPALADDSDDWPDCNTSEGNSAIAACTRILQRWEASESDLSTAFNNRGLAYDNKGQLDLALADYNQALRLEPESALVYHNRGYVYNEKGAYDFALTDYTEAIRLDSSHDFYYNHRGIAFDNNGELDRALTDYDQAIRLNPNFDAAYYNRGVVYQEKDEYDRAISDFDRAIRLNPNDADYYNHRGNAFYAKGDYDRALTDYQQAIKLKPDFAYAYSNGGSTRGIRGEYDRAIADFDKAIRLDPNNAEFYYKRGTAFINKGDYDRAIADYDQAIRLKPTTSAYGSRALAYSSKGEYDRAIADCDQALKLDPNNDTAYNNRAFASIKKGDYDRALADLDQGIKVNSTSARLYKNRGDAYRGKGDLDRALADLDRAIKLEPELIPAYTIRGVVYQAKGNRELASADFSKALSLRAEPIDSDAQATAREQLAALNKKQPAAPVAAAIPALGLVPGDVPEAEATEPPLASSASNHGKRIALVIGNSAYRTANPLKNPNNDAHAVAKEFRRLGFADVIEKHDLTLNELSSELKSFGVKALDADWAVVYYAGHGIEVAGVNYVIPVDAELTSAIDVEEEAIPLNRVLSKVEGAHKLRLVILDACRDNPFAQRLASAGGGTRSVGRGLGRVEPPGGIVVFYSARDGHVARDGSDANSPFAQALVQHLDEPGLEVGLLFRKVHDSVWNATHEQQEPFTYGALPAEAFYFKTAGN